MSTRSMLFSALLLLTPGMASAQEGFSPSNDELNRELDESLREEYEAPPPPPPVTRPSPNYAAVSDPGHPVTEDDDRFELRLGGMVAHTFTRLQNVTLAYREGSSGGQEIDLEQVFEFDDDIDLDDLDSDSDVWHNSQSYKAWFDIGKHVSLQAGFWRTVYRHDGQAQQGFTFGRSSFGAGQALETKIDMAVADFDLVVKPINNRYVSFDLHFGGRYLYWNTRIRRTDTTAQTAESSTIEAGLPMVGMGLTLRPIKEFQLFARGRIGYMSYQRDPYYRYEGNGQWDYVERKERSATSGQAEAGILVMFMDTIGFTLGYRLDYIELERDVNARRTAYEGFAHGAFAGAILEF